MHIEHFYFTQFVLLINYLKIHNFFFFSGTQISITGLMVTS